LEWDRRGSFNLDPAQGGLELVAKESEKLKHPKKNLGVRRGEGVGEERFADMRDRGRGPRPSVEKNNARKRGGIPMDRHPAKTLR